jgi:hypothetical protein
VVSFHHWLKFEAFRHWLKLSPLPQESVFSIVDEVHDEAVGLAYVFEGAIAEAADGGIIFLAGDVLVDLIDQLQGLLVAIAMAEFHVDVGMILEILAIIDGSLFDLGDSFVDLVDGVLLQVVDVVGRRELIEQSASIAQIAERMQVVRMFARGVGPSESAADGDYKHQNRAMSYSLHGLLLLLAEWFEFGREIVTERRKMRRGGRQCTENLRVHFHLRGRASIIEVNAIVAGHASRNTEDGIGLSGGREYTAEDL